MPQLKYLNAMSGLSLKTDDICKLVESGGV